MFHPVTQSVLYNDTIFPAQGAGPRGRDRIVVWLAATYAISAYHE